MNRLGKEFLKETVLGQLKNLNFWEQLRKILMNIPIVIGLLTLVVSSFLVSFLIVTFKPKDKAEDYDKKDTEC